MELINKIQQLATQHASHIALVSTEGAEFKRYLDTFNLEEGQLKPRQKETILTDLAYQFAFAPFGEFTISHRDHGEMGEPLWPAGFIGSVTHKNGIALVIVSKDIKYKGIGIDLEYFNPQRERKIQYRILSAKEQKIIQDSKCFQFNLLLLFSAKESIFKAIYPLAHQFVGFKDVELRTKNENSLTFVLKRNLGDNFQEGNEIKVEYLAGNEYLFTLAAICRK